MKVALGADHRGFSAKNYVKAVIHELGMEIMDFGTDSTKSCDYPDPALAAARAVQTKQCDVGILFCGTGIGMCVTANKLHGIRAALCHDELTAEMSRRHNDANVLCLPADLVGDALMRRIVSVWLKTPFESGRHQARLDKIADIERLQCNDGKK